MGSFFVSCTNPQDEYNELQEALELNRLELQHLETTHELLRQNGGYTGLGPLDPVLDLHEEIEQAIFQINESSFPSWSLGSKIDSLYIGTTSIPPFTISPSYERLSDLGYSMEPPFRISNSPKGILQKERILIELYQLKMLENLSVAIDNANSIFIGKRLRGKNDSTIFQIGVGKQLNVCPIIRLKDDGRVLVASACEFSEIRLSKEELIESDGMIEIVIPRSMIHGGSFVKQFSVWEDHTRFKHQHRFGNN